MFLPNLGPNTNTNAGFANSSISDQETFMSRIRKYPRIPTVGVSPKPKVVALKLALVVRLVICFQEESSGSQTPASIAVDVFDLASIAYTFKNGNIQTSGRIFTPFLVATALLKRITWSSG